MHRFASYLLLAAFFIAHFAGTEDYVRVRLDTPSATPFSIIRYEITKRGPATTAVHRRTLPGHAESFHALGLLTTEETEAIDNILRETKAMALRSAVPKRRPAGAVTWSVELLVDGKKHRFKVTDPENLKDQRYARLIHAVRRQVRAVTAPLPFRNVFFSPKRRGWLNIVSVPIASVSVDGFDTKLTTPLYSYELPAGKHTISLKSIDGTLKRSYDIQVEPGGSTNLRVDLR